MSREVIGWGRDGADADPFDSDVPAPTPEVATAVLPTRTTGRATLDGPTPGIPTGSIPTRSIPTRSADEAPQHPDDVNHQRDLHRTNDLHRRNDLDDPHDLDGPDDLDDPDDEGGPGWLDRLGGLGRRRLVGAVLALSAALGLLAPGLGPTDLLERPTPVVVALVTESRSQAPTRGAGVTTLQVAVSNLSPTPVQLVGFDSAFVAAEVTRLPDAGRTIDPGTTLSTELGVAVLCDASSPLVLPTMRLRDRDGVEFHLSVAGAVQAMVDGCTGGDTPPVLSLSRPSVVEESRLKVSLATLGDRTLRLLAMNLDDVALTGRPLPSTMDNPTRVVWLNAPDTCPDLWRTRGLPTQLDVVLATTLDRRYDGEGTADVSLPIGPVLAQWLSDTACKGVS